MGRLYFEREYELAGLHLAPLTPVIGAMVSGIDLRHPLPPETRGALDEGLRRHKVLFFRGQPLTIPEFVAFGRRLGPLESYTLAAGTGGATGEAAYAGHPEVRVFDYGESQRGREAFWHFDVLPSRQPATAAILRARVVPEVGGDTLFCDVGAVHDALPEALRTRLAGAAGLYDFVFERQLARFRGKSEGEVMAIAPAIPLEEIPLVRVECDGRRVLLVNPGFLVGIKGMGAEESREILAEVRSRIARPEVQCRFRWERDDIAFWDNRACLHYATNNYFPQRRTMERLTVVDEAPLVPGNGAARRPSAGSTEP